MTSDSNTPQACDIKAIIVLLTTQAMINLGELLDPVSREKRENLRGAKIFLDLLNVLKEKTKGNLNTEEEAFMAEVITNLSQVYQRKSGH